MDDTTLTALAGQLADVGGTRERVARTVAEAAALVSQVREATRR